MRSWLGDLEIMSFVLMLFWVGKHVYIMYLFYILCIAHPFCVCLAMIE